MLTERLSGWCFLASKLLMFSSLTLAKALASLAAHNPLNVISVCNTDIHVPGLFSSNRRGRKQNRDPRCFAVSCRMPSFSFHVNGDRWLSF